MVIMISGTAHGRGRTTTKECAIRWPQFVFIKLFLFFILLRIIFLKFFVNFSKFYYGKGRPPQGYAINNSKQGRIVAFYNKIIK